VKINLLIDNPGDLRSGYLNVDAVAPDGCTDGRVKGDLSNLDEFVDDGEATEIVALDVLDCFPGADASTVLSRWCSKLAHGGTLTVSVVDVREVARGVLANTLSPDDTNELLHGKQEKPWQHRKAAYSLAHLAGVFTSHGYRVLAKRVQNYRAVITIQRP
jgi:hypothetical protein